MTRIPPPHLCGLGCGSQTVVVHKVRAKNRPCQSFYVEMLLTNLKAGETRVGYAGSSLTSTRATASDCTNNRPSSQQHRNSSNRDNGMGRESRCLIEPARTTLRPVRGGIARSTPARDGRPRAGTRNQPLPPPTQPRTLKTDAPSPARPSAGRRPDPARASSTAHTRPGSARAPRQPHAESASSGSGPVRVGRGPAPDRRTSVGSDSATRIA